MTLAALQHGRARRTSSGDATVDPALAHGHRAARRRSAPAPSAIAARVPATPRSSTPRRSPAAARCPGSTIPSVGVARRRRRRRRRAAPRLRAHGVIARIDDGAVVCDLRTVDPGDDAHAGRRARAPRRGAAPTPCGSSPPPATSTTASRRSSSRSPAPIPTGSPRRRRAGSRSTSASPSPTLPSGRRSASSTCPATSASSRTCSPASAPSTSRCSSSPPTKGGCRRARSTCASSTLLGVRHGVVALTKADTVDADDARGRPRSRSASTWRARRSGTRRSSCATRSSGRGLDDLRTRPRRRPRRRAPRRDDVDRPRLWIDRVFAAKGAGTVVTGTLPGGSVAVDDTLGSAARPCRARPRHRERARGGRARSKPGRASRSTSSGSSVRP